ncbi:hypothetical protein BBW65_06530 [Helicobacter enhydrae]|uniref:Autotransporter domain-containing protein n=1 Tax=Helicobacter enhydrae TaxID=222136 RepID=A0A1B1U6Q1_9HELI|nr:autotransporter outer membrane beta-barrel domain-containing protein [Helicobacter enhydrae]ANV98473.1 hypothetical protein BBW65_06530 [Helicobacter enhydrae]
MKFEQNINHTKMSETRSQPKPSTRSFSMNPNTKNLTRSFKPLIATSLALALSMSVASADPCPTNDSAVCYGSSESALDKYTQIQFNTDNSSALKPKYGSGTLQNINNLTFKFTQNGTNSETKDPNYIFNLATSNTTLKLLGVLDNGQWLDMNDGRGTITIDFGTNPPTPTSPRKAILDLQRKKGSNTATILKGGIEVKASNSNQDEVKATFAGNMEGSITITGQNTGNTLFTKVQTDFTFKSGSLIGDLAVKMVEGGQNFVFENGGITGDIKTEGLNGNSGITSLTNPISTTTNITFNSSNSKIIGKSGGGSPKGEIHAISDQKTKDANATNKILFVGNGEIGSSTIKTSITAGDPLQNQKGESRNLIQFQKEATLHLENLATYGKGEAKSYNILSLEGGENHTLNITNITATAGQNGSKTATAINLIGKGFLTPSNGNEAKNLRENITEAPTNANIASGTLTVGTIQTGQHGINKIFIQNLKITTKIESGISGNVSTSTNLINANNATIKTMLAQGGGINFIGQNIPNDKLNGDSTGDSAKGDFLSDTYAMQGQLQITEGISSESGGINNISFKAKGEIAAPIIGKNTTTNNAINKRANIYLNLKEASIASGINIIEGNINATASETINLKIKGVRNGSIKGDFIASGSEAKNIFTLTSSTLTLEGKFTETSNGENQATLTNSTLTIKNTEGTAGASTISNLTLNDSKLIIGNKGTQNTILKLISDENNHIDLRSGSLKEIETETKFNLLTFGGTGGTGLQANNLLFRVFADPNAPDATLGGVDSAGRDNTHAYSDRIKVESGKAGVHTIEVTAKPHKWGSIKYTEGKGTEEAGNIAVAIVKNNTGITFKGGSEVIGFETIQTTLKEVKNTDGNGKITGAQTTNYTTYFLSPLGYGGITQTSQDITASAMGSTYALYLANFNSLNKRMGELRDTTNAQGVWARVFNGSQSLNFGIQSQTIYTTIQAGYDYAVGFEGANNYIGFALSYANSTTKAKNVSEINGTNRGITSMTSNAIEFALYNAYVQNGASSLNGWSNGLYSDSILKFSYITSDAKLVGATASAMSNTAFTLSEEVGYRFLLGDQQWFITPQAEVAFGYLSRGNLNQKNGIYTLNSTQENIITLSNRIGSDVGYTFDIPKEKGFQAKLYLGTYFVYDYLIGGEINSRTGIGTQSVLTPFTSSAKGVINVGTNLEVKDNTRIYFDFERSFGGKVVTDYQINLGVRYGFGEKGGGVKVEKGRGAEQVEKDKTTETETNKAPLKVQGDM